MMEQKSTAVKTLTNGIAHLFKQNKVLYWLIFYLRSFLSVGIRFWANNNSYLQNEPAFFIDKSFPVFLAGYTSRWTWFNFWTKRSA